VCALSAALIGLICVCIRCGRELKRRIAREEEVAQLQQALYSARSECARCHREIDALKSDVEEEQARSDGFEAAYHNQLALTERACQQVRREEARRIEAEKSVYAGRMRIDLLEKEVSALQREQTAQELLYQDILRDREETIARLQEPTKKRIRKRPEVLDQQITLNDLLGEK